MMIDKKKRFPLFVLANFVFLFFVGAAMTGVSDTRAATASPWMIDGSPLDEDQHDAGGALAEAVEIDDAVDAQSLIREEADPATAVVPSSPWANYPNVCETFNMIQNPTRRKDSKGNWHYPVNYKRQRYQRTRKDRVNTSKLVEFVAKEMGVEHPELFVMFAMHESTWNPEAIHILNPDLEANQKAWKRHSYDATREAELEEKLAKSDARTKEYWKIKAQLADIRLYKGNQHWNDRLAYDYIIPEHTVKVDGEEQVVPEVVRHDSRNVWGFGYGLYGMYAVGYVKVWDREAPPWILCGEEGIIATIIQVWAARNAAAECDNLTDKNPEKWGTTGGTYEGVVRRLARGHCSDKRLGKVWQRLMKEYDSIPWDGKPDLGDKWTQWEMKKRRGKWVYKRDENGKKIPTDREAILAHMIEKARKKGLLREQPLELRDPKSAPVVVAAIAAGNEEETGGGSSAGSVSAAP
jgi:hypothetical protein